MITWNVMEDEDLQYFDADDFVSFGVIIHPATLRPYMMTIHHKNSMIYLFPMSTGYEKEKK